jgi:toxin ParE1/3/4
MAAILIRPRAKVDLIEIWNYIADDSETQADMFIDNLDQKFVMLAKHPNIGRRRAELHRGLKSFPVGRYVIFFLSTPDGVEIVRVLHSARDITTDTFADESL